MGGTHAAQWEARSVGGGWVWEERNSTEYILQQKMSRNKRCYHWSCWYAMITITNTYWVENSSQILNVFARLIDVSFPDILGKSKDYVYGISVYKVLGIWKGYYRVKKSLVSCTKPWTEARNNKYMKYHSKLTYQLSFWNVSQKWTIMQEASGSSTAPDAARRISC